MHPESELQGQWRPGSQGYLRRRAPDELKLGEKYKTAKKPLKMYLPTYPCGWIVSSSNANSLQVRERWKIFFFLLGWSQTNKQPNCFQGVALCPDPCQLLSHKTVPRLCSPISASWRQAAVAFAIAPFHCGPPTALAAHVAADLQPCALNTSPGRVSV